MPIQTLIKAVGTGALFAVSIATHGSVITVTDADPSWGTAPGDTNSTITTDRPRSGNGSLRLEGDRTRFFGLGNPFDPTSNLGLLDDLEDFKFDWLLDSASTSNLNAKYTPALRLHLFDSCDQAGNNCRRSELIWEGAYNGVYSSAAFQFNTWYTTSFNDFFWQWVAGGAGVTADYDETITDWKSAYADDAYISSISVGVGSSAGNDYFAFADNVTIKFAGADATTYNFETQSSAVPAPATLALFGFGLAAIGWRQRSKK